MGANYAALPPVIEGTPSTICPLSRLTPTNWALVSLINHYVPTEMDVDAGTVVLGLVLDTLSGRSPLYRLEEFFAHQDTEVALHLTVVKLTCNKNGGPDILLLACFHTKPGGPSWTPQLHSAPMRTAMPEAKLAMGTLVSIRGRSSGSSVMSATKPSAPPPARSSIGCVPRQKLWSSS